MLKITAFKNPISFQRALKSTEEKDFNTTIEDAKKELNIQQGIHLFKVFQTALPTNRGENLGIGKLNSQEAIDYLKFMALYTGSNAVKIYPNGSFSSRLRFPHYYCPYERMSTVLGIDNINFFKLTQSDYGSLLSKDDIRPYTISDDACEVDYENELDRNSGADYRLIEKAYENMMKNKGKDSKKIYEEFLSYKTALKSDTLDRLAIAPFVKDKDPFLFKGISQSPCKTKRFENYKKEYQKEIDIFKFTSFLAEKNLQEARKELNKQGLELFGDCPIGFSEDEVFAFYDAFYPPSITPGWGFRAIKYDSIPKSGTEANRLFGEKIGLYLNNFDGIRFDVGWQYISPKLYKVDKKGNRKDFDLGIQDEIIDYINKTAHEIKGEGFDLNKLIYECDAGAEDFQMFDWKDGVAYPRKIMDKVNPVLTSVYENANGMGWGQPDFFEKAGLNNYIIGTNNHDSTPLRILAEEEIDDNGNQKIELSDIRKDNRKALCVTLNLDYEFLKNPKNFIKAKFAQLFLAKNHFLFFNDVQGSNKRMDRENSDANNYRFKITDYENQYHTMLQNGCGFNLAESLRLALKAKGIDKTNPDLYAKIKYYSNLLYEKGATTKAQADKTPV